MRGSIVLAAAISWIGCGGAQVPETGPSASEQHLAAAEAHEKHRRYDQAETEYRRAVASAADAAETRRARRELIDALLFWGKLREASVELETMTRAFPDDARSWHDLGIVRANLGDLAGAELALERAARLAPKDPRPKIALAALLVRRRQLSRARAIYVELRGMNLGDDMRRAIDKAIRLLDGERPH